MRWMNEFGFFKENDIVIFNINMNYYVLRKVGGNKFLFEVLKFN